MIILTGEGQDDIEQALLALRGGAISARRKAAERRRWRECHNAYHNRLLTDLELPAWRARFETPDAFEVVERMVPTLTDSKPRMAPVGEEKGDNALVERIVHATEREWDEQDMQLITPALLRDVLVYGTGHAYVRLLPGYLSREPRIATELLSPWSVFPHPGSTFDKIPDVIWTRHRLSEGDLYHAFGPDMAENVMRSPAAFVGDNDFDEDEDNIERDNEFLITISGTAGSIRSGGGNSDVSHGARSGDRHQPRYDIWVGYFHDGSLVERTIAMNDGSEEKVEDLEYPYGRMIIMAGTRYIPDLDFPNPFPHRRCPVIRVGCMDLRGSWWGRSYLEPGLGTIEKMAMIDNRILDHVALTLNTVKVVDSNSGVDMETIYSYPGLVIPKNPGTEFRQDPPPQLPSYVFQMRQLLQQQFNNAMGISDISRGNLPTLEDVSGRAIEAATAPTYTRIRAVQRNFEKFVTEWGERVVPMLLKYKPESWWYRLTPPDVDPMTGQEQPLPWAEWTDDDYAQLPDLRMTAGSSLPTDQRTKRTESINLYDRGAFGEPKSPGAVLELLKDHERPNAEEIASRIEQDQMQMQQMQQEQAAMGAAGPTPFGGADRAMGLGPSPAEEAGNPEPPAA